MRPIAELNLSHIISPPGEEEIKELERLIGFKLPQDYLNLINHINGAHPELDTFTTEDGLEFAINNFFAVGGKPDMGSVIWNYFNSWEGTPKEFLPIARDGGDNVLLLHLENGSIWVWIHDVLENNLYKLCDNLEALIDGLHLNPDYI